MVGAAQQLIFVLVTLVGSSCTARGEAEGKSAASDKSDDSADRKETKLTLPRIAQDERLESRERIKVILECGSLRALTVTSSVCYLQFIIFEA